MRREKGTERAVRGQGSRVEGKNDVVKLEPIRKSSVAVCVRVARDRPRTRFSRINFRTSSTDISKI